MGREFIGWSGGEVCQQAVTNREVQLDALHNHLHESCVGCLVESMSQYLSLTQPAHIIKGVAFSA